MEDHNISFGLCGRCCKAVHSDDGACRAMGQIFHSECFTCSSCRKTLSGEPFYTISGKIYCEDDFLYSGIHPAPEVCASCGHLLQDNVLQACGTSYHPSCFRCVSCGQSLEEQPFTVDTENKKVYCVSDYHKLKAPRCAACKMPILQDADRGLDRLYPRGFSEQKLSCGVFWLPSGPHMKNRH